VQPPGPGTERTNFRHLERLVKMLLWQWGGWRVWICGPQELGEQIRQAYSPDGARAFDADFMGMVYGQPFTVEVASLSKAPESAESRTAVGGHLDGCRIGFDAGASDHKVAAVVDGEPVFSEEVIWHPKDEENPDYHREHIRGALRRAASHMPRVDAIGVSSAGVYVDNRVRVASLFRGIPRDAFEEKVAGIYLDLAAEIGSVPVEVRNDGDVTALAGAVTLEAGNVLGIAMGSSEAAGYVDGQGRITGWLNELAFAPLDMDPEAPEDEWSGDRGCGVQYLSQVGAIRLAESAGLDLALGDSPAEKLKMLQVLHSNNHRVAELVYESLGAYLGYAIAHYADFYEIDHVLTLGRVTSGQGGQVMREWAERVLKVEFPRLAERVTIHLPDDYSRRVGQAVAAASLPETA
jgi:predicted NBD/HSP70 family sugar kinase